jgi:hypothetical protein
MLADEITAELRDRRAHAIAEAVAQNAPVTRPMSAKGIEYGTVTAKPDGTVDSSNVQGVDLDLRVRPFFAHGQTTSIREFIAIAMNNEMGFQCLDPEITNAFTQKAYTTTPAAMVLDGRLDTIELHRFQTPRFRAEFLGTEL